MEILILKYLLNVLYASDTGGTFFQDLISSIETESNFDKTNFLLALNTLIDKEYVERTFSNDDHGNKINHRIFITKKGIKYLETNLSLN